MQLHEQQVSDEIRRSGPRAAFETLIARNDALILAPRLDNGRAIAGARSAIYTTLAGDWAAEQHRRLGYDKPFALVALGGTGREEMAPCSDNDFAFLFEDALEGNPFLLELQRQVLHTDEFRKRCGFTCLALPFSLEDVPNLSGKQLNSFLDLRAVHDPGGLTEVFRERIRSTVDPFEHFLHVRGFWRDQWEKAAAESENIERFDIKNDGLRVFLAGIWTLSGRNFRHSHEIYQSLDDPRDLEAYEFLMRLRAFVHLRRNQPVQPSPGGNHPEDLIGFDDCSAFGDWLGPDAGDRARFEFANEVRARLLSARRRVARFAKGVIEGELKSGRRIGTGSPIVYGLGGLHRAAPRTEASPADRSRAALGLLLAAQRYGVQVDPTELQGTFRDAGDWLTPVPELSALFYEQRGSLADSLAFLAQLDGAEERLFPGHGRFEASLDGRARTDRTMLRGALARKKLRVLDRLVRDGRTRLANAIASRPSAADADRNSWAPIGAAQLDADHLAGVKLALKTKRLPLTNDDLAARGDESRAWHERFASGFSEIRLADYYPACFAGCEFSAETLALAEFLVAHRHAFLDRATAGINDDQQVEEFARLCRDEARLRALFVFTCADRVDWESDGAESTRWFNTCELYNKALAFFRPPTDPTRALAAEGYAPDELNILQDFGRDFFGGFYRNHANRFGPHLVRLVEDPDVSSPKVALLPEGTATLLGVAARDYRGLAATISGALWHHGIELRQAHLFSAAQHGLALDFFHVSSQARPLRSEILRAVEEAILNRRYIADADEAGLPRIVGETTLEEWRHGLHCLRHAASVANAGMIYVLTYKIFRHLRGDIFALSAHATRGKAFVSVYHRLPPDLSLAEARAIVARSF